MKTFEVRESNLGKGVWALKKLEAGEELCVFSGEPVNFEETLEMGNKESFAFQVGNDLYIFLNAPYRYFNHSCEPNCGITPDLKLVTIKQIENNEELRWDYSTSMMEHHWTMKCKCKKETCRKVVADFITLPKKTQQYYLDNNVVQGFIVEMLNSK